MPMSAVQQPPPVTLTDTLDGFNRPTIGSRYAIIQAVGPNPPVIRNSAALYAGLPTGATGASQQIVYGTSTVPGYVNVPKTDNHGCSTSVLVGVGNNMSAGLVVRLKTTDGTLAGTTCVLLWASGNSGGNQGLWSVVNGSLVKQATLTGTNAAYNTAGDSLILEANGNVYTAKRIRSGTQTTIATWTDASNIITSGGTGRYCGLFAASQNVSSVEVAPPGLDAFRVYDLVAGSPPSLTSTPVGLYEATGPYPTACQDYWATITGVTDLVKPAAGDRKYAITAWYPTTATSGRRARYLTETSNDTAMATANAAVYSGLSATLIPPMAAKLVNSYLNAPIRTDLGQMPVLIFSPGRVVAREMGSALCEEMASHGYIVLALGHTYEAPSVEFPSSLEGNITYTNTNSEYNAMMRQRIADARHLLANLSTLLGNGLYQQMDTSNIGAFGHSYGGYLAGELAYVEPTLIKAAMNHDGSPGRTGNDNFACTNGFSAPYFFLSTDDNARSDPLWAPMKALLTGDVYDVKANGTKHYSFMDTCTLVPAGSKALYCGTVTPVRGIEIGRAYTLAFFNHYLKGTTEALLAGASGSYPEIQFF